MMGAILGLLKYGLIAGKPMQIWYSICLTIDGIVYSFINFLFKLFLVLANTNIFSNDETYALVGRIYQLIGVVMLFVFTYALLRKIVTPDSKDKESPSKMVFSVVKAIILLAIVPSIFSYAFQIQSAILQQNTIGKLILGTSGNNTAASNPNDIINKGGITMAQGVFEAFFFPTNGDKEVEVMSGVTYKQMEEEVQKTGNFSIYKNVTDKVDDGTITYYMVMALIAGGAVVYMLISYCISLGFRIIKLAFYEVMAPVCIIASILPSQKEMLSRWIKTTLQVFLEVFIRIAILFFITYLIEVIRNSFNQGTLFPTGLDFRLKALAFAAIIMGLVTFMKSAPDLISKLTGIESGNMSLGIREQLAKGGLFTAGALAGSVIGGGLRNAAGAVGLAHERRKAAKAKRDKDIKAAGTDAAKQKKAKRSYRWATAKSVGTALWGLTGSAAAGAISAGVHSGAGEAKDAKTMKEARDKGIKYSVGKHAERATYNDANGGFFRAKGHRVSDFFRNALATYAGIKDPNAIRAKLESEEELKKANDDLSSAAEAVVKNAMSKSQKIDFELGSISIGGTSGIELFAADFRKKLSVNGRKAIEDLEKGIKGMSATAQAQFYKDHGIRLNSKGELQLETAADLRNLQDYIQAQKLAMKPEAANLDDAFGTIFKCYSKAVSNQGLLGEDDAKALRERLKATINDDTKTSEERTDAQNFLLALGEMEVAGARLRGAISRSLGDAAVQDAGITYANVKKDVGIRVDADAFKQMMDNIDVSRSELRTVLAKLNEAEKNSGDDKK